ncbi:carboxypeptidase-like regulatory domain-containing protein, partial [bacterium]
MSLGSRPRFIFGTCLILSILFLQSSWAQGSGTLKGTIYDKQSKDALPGAHVVVKGTSIGAATNLSGGYILYNVPAGTHTIVASYIGYRS